MIAYNLQPIAVRGLTGIGNYTAQVASRLIDSGSEIHAFDFLQRNGAREILSENLGRDLSGSDLHIVRSLPLSVYIRMGSFGKIIPYETLTNSKADLTVFFNYLAPKGLNGKRIITVYDMVSERYPETMQGRNRRLLQTFLRDSILSADTVITISEFSKSEVCSLIGVPEQKVCVAPCGVDTDYYKSFDTKEQETAARGVLKDKFGIDDYILYVGTLEPRKNVGTLIKAFDMIADDFPHVKLVLAGGMGWQSETTLAHIAGSKNQDRIVRTGFVTNDEKRDLYRCSKVFAFPSMYEGFGMPVTEAQACGVPCVISNASSLPEASGGLALMSDPMDERAFAENLTKVLSGDFAPEREALISSAARFTWDGAAEVYKQAIKELRGI